MVEAITDVDTQAFKTIGEWISNLITSFIQYLASFGVSLTPTQGKILSILLVLGVGYSSFKIIEKPVRYIIIILAIVLTVSIALTFV